MLSVMPSVRYSICGSPLAVHERQDRERLAARLRGRGRRRPCAADPVSSGAQRHRQVARRTRTGAAGSRSTQRATIARSSAGAAGSIADRSGSPSRSSLATTSCGVAPVEQPPAGEHLVEHAAGGEDVAAAVDPLAGDLLRRHVAERAEHDARRRSCMPVDAGRRGPLEPLQREAEVQDLDRAVGREEDVLRLQVAMDDAFRRAPRPGRRRSRRRSRPPRATAAAPASRRARRVCPSSSSMTAKGTPSATPSSWIDRMLGCESAATARASVSKRCRIAGIRGDVLGHDLDRDVAREPQVARAIHLAHAAGAERAGDFVLRETGTWSEGMTGKRADFDYTRGLTRCGRTSRDVSQARPIRGGSRSVPVSVSLGRGRAGAARATPTCRR